MGKKFGLNNRGEPIELKNRWVTYYPFIYGFSLTFNKAGYFDPRPYIHIKLIGELFIHLPFDSKIYNSQSAQYGIYYHERQFWIGVGGKLKSFRMFWDKEWIRTSYLLKDNNWLTETKKKRVDHIFHNDLWKEYIKYKYKTKNGDIIDVVATITIEEREWRFLLIKWVKLFPKIVKDISVNLSTDIGNGRGSYKGGTTGFSIPFRKGETCEQVLQRMEEKWGLYSIEKERMRKIESIYEFI